MLRYIIKSLYKNDVIVEERKKRPIWLAIIFLILGLGIYMIPQIVSLTNQKGSEIMTKKENYELDKGLVLFAQDKFDAYIDEKGILSTTDKRLLNAYEAKEPVKSYILENYKEKEDSEPVTATFLNLYYYDADPMKDKTAQSDYNKWVNENIYKIVDDKKTVAPKSFMVITKTCFIITVYSPTNDNVDAKAASSFTGLFSDLKKTNLNSLCVEEDGKLSQKETYSNLVTFLNKSYESTKVKSMWINIALTFGMNVVMVLIGSLVIFLFLRGKTSRYKGVSFYDSLKISFTMAFTPAVIGALISLALPIYNFAFMGAFICRVMWLVTKSKTIETPAPVYQART